MKTKATFTLDSQKMQQAKKLVEKGTFKSMNAFVEIAIADELDKIEKELIKKAIIEAGQDPLFLADIKEIEKDFEYTDFENPQSEL